MNASDRRQRTARPLGRDLRVVLGLLAGAHLLLSVAPASAQSAADSATAQALFERAKKLMSEGKFSEACPALEESQHIESRSGTLLNLADCYEHAGRLASAWSSFLDAATLAKAGGNAERENVARARAAGLVPRLSNLVIDAPSAASTSGLEITRDGKRVGPAQLGLAVPADAGPHVIAAQAPGRKPWRTEVTVPGAAGTVSVTVPELQSDEDAATARAATGAPSATVAAQPAHSDAAPTAPAPEHAPSRMTTGVIVGGIATGALAMGTVVTGVLYGSALSDYNTANAHLADNRSELHSQTVTLGAINLALLGGTVVAAGVTVFLWTRPPSATAPATAKIAVHATAAPGWVGLRVAGSL